MCDLVQDNFLHQMVKDPTRYCNLLDLDIVQDVQVVDNLPPMMQFSLHLLLLLHLNPTVKGCCIITRKLTCPFCVKLCLMFLVEGTSDIEESWQLFEDLFLSALNVSVPHIQWRRRKLKHWSDNSFDSSKTNYTPTCWKQC